jgi:hypothetical protein
MFVREKPIGPYRYVYLVESVREGGRTKQRIIKNLGRKEQVDAKGDLDRLARSDARLRRDLDRLQEVAVVQDGKRFILRTPTTGCAGKLFQTLGVALPPNIRDADLQAADTVAEPALL